ncbi:hydrolase, partial [Enterococcus faecium]
MTKILSQPFCFEMKTRRKPMKFMTLNTHSWL